MKTTIGLSTKVMLGVVAFPAAILCSCNDDRIFEKEQYKNVFALVSTEDTYNTFGEVFHLAREESDGFIGASMGGTVNTDRDLHIDMVCDSSLLDMYNIGNFDVDESRYARLMPESKYTVDDYRLTVPAGMQNGRMKIRVRPEGLSPDTTYFIPLKVQSFSGYDITPKKDFVLYRVRIRNRYASQNTVTNYPARGVINGVNIMFTKRMHPVSSHKVRIMAGNQAFEEKLSVINDRGIYLEIAADGKVTVTPVENLTIEQLDDDSAYPNKFFIEDDGYRTYKTFLLHYRYRLGAGAATEVREELRLPFRMEAETPEDFL